MKRPGPLSLLLVVTCLFVMLFAKVHSEESPDPPVFQIDTLQLFGQGMPVAEPDSIIKPEVFAGTSFFGPHELPASMPMQPVSRITDSSATFVSLWIIFCLVIVSLAKYLFPLRFRETLMAVWESRFYSQIEREGGLINNWVSFFLFLNFLFSVSLLFYLTLPYTPFVNVLSHIHPLILLAYGLAGALVFYLIKYILMVFVAWIFKTQRPTGSYLRTLLLVNQFVGIALLPIVIIAFYNPYAWILYFAWGIIGVMALYKLIRVSAIGSGITDISVYHLILYLCTIEIAPVLFLVKFSNSLVMS